MEPGSPWVTFFSVDKAYETPIALIVFDNQDCIRPPYVLSLMIRPLATEHRIKHLSSDR